LLCYADYSNLDFSANSHGCRAYRWAR
jgi:hypothetical protein